MNCIPLYDVTCVQSSNTYVGTPLCRSSKSKKIWWRIYKESLHIYMYMEMTQANEILHFYHSTWTITVTSWVTPSLFWPSRPRSCHELNQLITVIWSICISRYVTSVYKMTLTHAMPKCLANSTQIQTFYFTSCLWQMDPHVLSLFNKVMYNSRHPSMPILKHWQLLQCMEWREEK